MVGGGGGAVKALTWGGGGLQPNTLAPDAANPVLAGGEFPCSRQDPKAKDRPKSSLPFT